MSASHQNYGWRNPLRQLPTARGMTFALLWSLTPPSCLPVNRETGFCKIPALQQHLFTSAPGSNASNNQKTFIISGSAWFLALLNNCACLWTIQRTCAETGRMCNSDYKQPLWPKAMGQQHWASRPLLKKAELWIKTILSKHDCENAVSDQQLHMDEYLTSNWSCIISK